MPVDNVEGQANRWSGPATISSATISATILKKVFLIYGMRLSHLRHTRHPGTIHNPPSILHFIQRTPT